MGSSHFSLINAFLFFYVSTEELELTELCVCLGPSISILFAMKRNPEVAWRKNLTTNFYKQKPCCKVKTWCSWNVWTIIVLWICLTNTNILFSPRAADNLYINKHDCLYHPYYFLTMQLGLCICTAAANCHRGQSGQLLFIHIMDTENKKTRIVIVTVRRLLFCSNNFRLLD